MQNVLHIHTTDVSAIVEALAEKREEAPQFFLHSPLILDCKDLGLEDERLDYSRLMSGLRELDFVPVGVRHLSPDSIPVAINSGWAVLRDSNAKSVEIKTELAAASHEVSDDSEDADTIQQDPATNTTSNRVMVINRPVRSGQQVYSADGDIVVLSQTGAGSEVLADGSIHVYGKISGRVLAGVNGDRSARIFCQGLEAELIAIAGCYKLLDEVDTSLKGQPAMISLDGEKLKIESMI